MATRVHKDLHQACKDNNLQKVQFLIDSGHVKIDYPDEDGLTPLDHASFLGHLEISQFLLKRGASVNSRAKVMIKLSVIFSDTFLTVLVFYRTESVLYIQQLLEEV
jgi:ankyrin repeat protein